MHRVPGHDCSSVPMSAGPTPDGVSAETSTSEGSDDTPADRHRGVGRDSQSQPEAASRALDPQSDDWLVGKARAGDPDALEVLIRRHRDRIYRIALRMLSDPDDAEDIAQDVVIQVWTALAGFTGASSFTTWLYRIVINRCINHGRRQRPTRPLIEADHPVAAGPEQTVMARGQVTATAAALTALPGDLRSALVLHEMEGLSYQEVAKILAVPEATVRGRIYRARRSMLTDLQEWS